MAFAGRPRVKHVRILGIAELAALGVATDPPATNETDRYVRFTAPDGHLYELIERR